MCGNLEGVLFYFESVSRSRIPIPAIELQSYRVPLPCVVLLTAVSAFFYPDIRANAGRPEPRLLSASPLGGTRGCEFEITVRGVGLEGLSGVWFEWDDVTADIRSVRKIAREEAREEDEYYAKQKRALLGLDDDLQESEVVLAVQSGPDTRPGLHFFRLTTPGGVTNSLSVHIVPERIVPEQSAPHQGPLEAQELKFPVVVNATLARKGEHDFYSFAVSEGETLEFRVLSGFESPVNYRAQLELSLSRRDESWFGGVRARPLVLSGPMLSREPVHLRTPWFDRKDFISAFVLYPNLRHTFTESGCYLVAVKSFVGRGGPGHDYQLKISRCTTGCSGSFGRRAHPRPGDWQERDSTTLRQIGSFRRKISDRRMQELRARSAHISGQEEEPDGESPLRWFEGVIERPGDVDRFFFQVRAGEQLAFEIETPLAAPPRFNPWLKVIDPGGNEVVSNIYKEYGGNGLTPNRCVERKTIHTFDQAGEYILEVSDLTTRLGDDEFEYRVLLRPQVPHLGWTEMTLGVFSVASVLVEATDRLNLKVGKPRKLTVVYEREEGFEGDVIVDVENLPPGVRVLPSSPASWTQLLVQGIQYRPPGVRLMDPESHRPLREAITVVLSAGPAARPTERLRFVEVQLRPVVSDTVGPPISAGRIPFMVLAPPVPRPDDSQPQASTSE